MKTPIDLTALFQRLDQSLARATGLPPLEVFAPPLTEADITAAEREIGLRLPDDLRQAYLWHDGLRHYAGAGPRKLTGLSLIPGFYWFSLANLVYRWKQDRDVEPRRLGQEPVAWYVPVPGDKKERTAIRYQEFDSRWIPVAVSSNGTYAYVDLNPSSSGVAGQVFALWGGGGTPWNAATSHTG